ncbi:2347_t:CDS:2 [Dentiscutata heterogama]|uniref:2347_t:CDS:1 n=1 Tax=Dentiscutata heterogama TaxID=1316150 RepID=A0ACA9K6C2_9GLOM|nr:2347_t:CDS:2 [Dentiscutata heterogama]
MDSIIKPNKCCCCISLRAGVITITILSLIDSIAFSFYFTSIIINGNENENYKDKIYLIYVYLVFSIIGLLVTIFGLIAVFGRRRAYLRVYSILFSICAAITVLLDIGGIIFVKLFFKSNIAIWIVVLIFDIIIAIYFALVVASYAAKHRESHLYLGPEDPKY